MILRYGADLGRCRFVRNCWTLLEFTVFCIECRLFFLASFPCFRDSCLYYRVLVVGNFSKKRYSRQVLELVRDVVLRLELTLFLLGFSDIFVSASISSEVCVIACPIMIASNQSVIWRKRVFFVLALYLVVSSLVRLL